MTECERYQELISRMADEELTKSERAALSAHMEHCSQCNAMYAVFSNLSEIIGQDTEPLPEGLHENIMADIRRSAIKQRNVKERRRFVIPKPFRNVVAAAACAAVVIFAAKGMLPEKMNDTSAMSESEAAAAAAPAATAAVTPQPTPAIPPSAAGSVQATQAPDVTAAPAASPEVQSAGTDEDKYSGGSAADNSENRPAPSNAPAAAPVSTPVPTQAPPVVETEKPRAVPTPAPTPVPKAAPEASSQSVPDESSAPAAVASEPEESEEPVGRFRSFFLKNAPVLTADTPAEDASGSSAPAEDNGVAVQSMDEPEASAAADSGKVIFAEIKTAAKRGELMRVLEGADSSPAPSESAKPEKPAESIKPEKPAESALPSPAPSAAVAEEALPAQDPDYVYEILFPQCRDEEKEEEEEEDFMSVCIFGEDIYWIVFSDDGDELVFRAECSVKEFEDFIKPFILPEASPSPEVSPAVQEPPRPVQ